MIPRPWTRTATGLRLAVRLTPRAGSDTLGGVRETAPRRPCLLARVTAPPADGAANSALIRLLAKSLGLPKSAFTIAAGESSRTKTLEIAGDPAQIEAALRRLV